MKAKSRVLVIGLMSIAAVALLLGWTIPGLAENEDMEMHYVLKGEVASEGGQYQAGVELILDADITQDDDSLIRSAIDVNGSAAIRVEDELGLPSQTSAAIVMVNNVSSKLNVREEPNKDGKIVGALYADCGGTILERKNGWTKLQSGNLVGWASDEYLLFGEDARSNAAQVGTTLGQVQVNGLTVRKEPSRQAGSYGILSQGETVSVFELTEGYVGIEYEGYDGYIAREYVQLSFIIDTGETNEEIAKRIREEEEAKARAAAEKAARKEALSAEKEAVSSVYSDLQLLAAIIYTEAGNQSYEGQVAVGSVVLNRVASPAYPDSVAGVLYASGQFSPVLTGRFAKCLEKGTYERCMQAAKDAMAGVNPIGGACHFHRVGSRTDGIIIGAHIFY